MKTIRHFLIMIFTFFFLMSAIPVSALSSNASLQPNAPWTEASVRTVLNEYFSSRESFLNQEGNSIVHTISPVVSDESKHLEFLEVNGIEYIDSSITITAISVYDKLADSNVEESISYTKNGQIYNMAIEHELTFTISGSGEIVVDSDAYYDASCGFRSCSYVSDTQFETNIYQVGGRNCLTNIAFGEEGYSEGSNNYTKYGVWYGAPNAEWCVIFVSWCANQASIPTSVIPKVAGTGDMRRFFGVDTDDSDYTPQYQGTAEPEVGDIFMFGTHRDDPVSHVGIVVGVNGDEIQIVHGNYPSSVRVQIISKYDSRLLAYGKPAFFDIHASSNSWAGDIYQHWHECSIYGDKYDVVAHSYVYQSSSKKYVCSTCGYTSDYAPGIVVNVLGENP